MLAGAAGAAGVMRTATAAGAVEVETTAGALEAETAAGVLEATTAAGAVEAVGAELTVGVADFAARFAAKARDAASTVMGFSSGAGGSADFGSAESRT